MTRATVSLDINVRDVSQEIGRFGSYESCPLVARSRHLLVQSAAASELIGEQVSLRGELCS